MELGLKETVLGLVSTRTYSTHFSLVSRFYTQYNANTLSKLEGNEAKIEEEQRVKGERERTGKEETYLHSRRHNLHHLDMSTPLLVLAQLRANRPHERMQRDFRAAIISASRKRHVRQARGHRDQGAGLGSLGLQVREEGRGERDVGEVVGVELLAHEGQVDGFGPREVETALDARVQDHAVEGRVGFGDAVEDEG
jgi:hypothetical protein